MQNWLNSLLLFWVFSLSGVMLSAQGFTSDIELVNQEIEEAHTHQSENEDNKADQIRVNPFYYLYQGFVWLYQKTLSAQISADCLYEPSCSHFSHQAVANYGFFKGVLLTTDRLSRCNRLAAYDVQKYQLTGKNGKVSEDIADFILRHRKQNKQ